MATSPRTTRQSVRLQLKNETPEKSDNVTTSNTKDSPKGDKSPSLCIMILHNVNYLLSTLKILILRKILNL